MESGSRSEEQGKGTLEELMRERIRATIETIVEEELKSALGATRSQRVGPVRVGYRRSKRMRTLSTSLGPTAIAMPRARIDGEDGGVASGAAGSFRAISAAPSGSTKRSWECT
jgi:transposase-like protein